MAVPAAVQVSAWQFPYVDSEGETTIYTGTLKIAPAEALASEQPFCIDTLTLPQWLQFIFLPRLYRLLEQDAALPDRCGIAPLAEEYFRGTGLPSAGLEQILLRMDEVLSEGTGGGQ